MSRRALTPLVFVASALSACESPQYPACSYADDPTLAVGTRTDACPASTFRNHDSRWPDVRGLVRQGDEGIPNAIVYIEPSGVSAYAGDPSIRTTTNDSGVYGPLFNVPFQYDMTVNVDRHVMVFRGLATPYFEPSLETDPSYPARLYRARVSLQTEAPIPDDHALALFASGTDVIGVEGDLASGLFVLTKTYDAKATLHALEYVKGEELSSAVAYGQVEVATSAGMLRVASLELDGNLLTSEPKFSVMAPDDFDGEIEIELLAAYTGTSFRRLTRARPGVPVKIPLFPAAYEYRAWAIRKDGARSDSNRVSFDPSAPETKIELPAPPSVEVPLDGASIEGTASFEATGEGVLEHLLVPEGRGPTVHVITTDRQTMLPSFEAVGANRPTGTWTWRIRSFPKLKSTRELGGSVSRRYVPFGTSAPRTITFR